jgi:hypothetical protein
MGYKMNKKITKLHLGCGNKKLDGFINVDKFHTDASDLTVDLEQLPWPWEDNSIDEIKMIHVLEHIGQSTEIYLGIIKEIYRICKNDAVIEIHVPHPRHDNFIGDPTHVRAITPQSLTLFNKELNDQWKQGGISAATTLAHFIGVDLRIVECQTILDPYWMQKYANGKISIEEVDQASRQFNNVITEWHIKIISKKEK